MTDYYDDSIYEQPETPRQEQEASHQEPEQSMPQMPHTPKKEKKNGKGRCSAGAVLRIGWRRLRHWRRIYWQFSGQ